MLSVSTANFLLIVLLQSVATRTVDLVLAGMLMLGGVVGAQLGARLGAGLKSEQLRGVLGALLLAAAPNSCGTW